MSLEFDSSTNTQDVSFQNVPDGSESRLPREAVSKPKMARQAPKQEMTQEVDSEGLGCSTEAESQKVESFAETALRLGGASVDEARRTGVIDTADDEVESLFAAEYKTTSSPIHRTVWERVASSDWFTSRDAITRPGVEKVISDSIAVVREHCDSGTLLDDHGKVSSRAMEGLARVGYWGMLVDRKYGGVGASMREFADMITRMAAVDPTVAGLASVHGCIGAVDPLRAFGSDAQRAKFLPGLADGSRLSAFALTEPGAGSDLTALKTTAHQDGDDFVINGEKLFITNATYGRTIGLVCKLDGVPTVMIAQLPDGDTESFSIKRYGLYALQHAHNNGLVFRNFRVPKENCLKPKKGDGLTVAYHGLNLGRVSLCANAAGTMRWMLAEMLPWASFRKTYGQPIAQRELVRRRIGHLAGLIVASDALTRWCADLLDQGYRGEMECIIAKIFGSESQKEAAIELLMKTHGGRSFLQGHLFGDNVHDFLAPCIYEGEGEMLGMAFFKSLVKQHGKAYFEPIGRTLNAMGVRTPNLANPTHLWALKAPMARYAAWYSGRLMLPTRWQGDANGEHRKLLLPHLRVSQKYLASSGRMISDIMRKHQLKLAERQCRLSAVSLQIQNAVTILVTSLYAMRSGDTLTAQAGDVICRELRRKISGGMATDEDYRAVTRLGATIAEHGWDELRGAESGKILQPYGRRVG